MMKTKSFLRALAASLVIAIAALSGFGQATRPQTTEAKNSGPDIQQWVSDLGSSNAQTRSDARIALLLEPPDAFEKIEAATHRQSLSPEVHKSLQEVVDRIKPWQAARLRIKKRNEEDQQWYHQLTMDSYTHFGKTNPKWDADAKAGIDLDASGGTTGHGRLEKAIEAGCDDPLVLYLEANYLNYNSPVDRDSVFAMYYRAASGMSATNYPRYIKAWVFMDTFSNGYDLCWAKAKAKGQKTPDKATWDKSWPWDHNVLNFWPDLARDNIPPRLLVNTAEQFTSRTSKIKVDMTPLFSIVEPPLEHVLPKALLLRYKGSYYIDAAWQARGGDWAYKVAPQNMQLFEERLALAERNYTEAWAADPTDPVVPTKMLQIELGEGKGNAVMEQWFQRAMQANPDDRPACEQKMWYLMPRWYGSHEKMLRFGHECFDTQNWYGNLPFVLITAHIDISKDYDDKSAYFAQADVWHDLQSVYEPVLRLEPDNDSTRSYYCYYACVSKHWEVARQQFKLLGPNVSAEAFGGAEEMKKFRDLAESNGASGKNLP